MAASLASKQLFAGHVIGGSDFTQQNHRKKKVGNNFSNLCALALRYEIDSRGFDEMIAKKIIKDSVGTLIALSLLVATSADATTLTCGLKTVTLSGNSITKIVHEDGTIHTGDSVSRNWTYDGKSITHRLMNEPMSCSSTAKSRDEVIAELSGRFSKNPKSYGMTAQEGNLMEQYSAMLMRQDSACHLLVDAAKSTSRRGMFYIDCNDKESNTKRLWVSEGDLVEGAIKQAATPVSNSDAISICNNELKASATNPSTYDPALILGTSSQAIESTGRNVVEINFEATNSFGVVGKYIGRCILESGSLIEVTIRDR